jgi:hypothetical protein
MKHHRVRYKRRHTRKEKLFLIISSVAIIIMAFIISMFTNSGSGRSGKITDHSAEYPHNGSAVRKETHTRKDYEKDYRQKDEDWQKRYSKILENKEDDKTLKELELKTKDTISSNH